jgi:plasmid maintenance system antidote protein VapI
MLEHPWVELQVLLKEKWLTQKAFASILWKKVSEVNELLKWKRNITIQRDYLLHQTLWTPIKYWILKQVDYDYSLLDIEESSDSPLEKEGLGEIWSHSERSEESIATDVSFWTKWRIQENIKPIDSEAELSTEETNWTQIVPPFKRGMSEGQGDSLMQPQETPAKELNTQDSSSSLHSSSEWQKENKDNEDLKNRAKIFRSF